MALLTSAGSANPFRSVCKTVTLSSGNVWNGVSSSGITASFDTEGAETSDDTPTLLNPQIPVHMGRVFVPASIEVVQDVDGLVNELSTLFADAKNELEVDKFTSGTGTAEPTGILAELEGTGRVVSMATNSAFAVGDLYSTVEGLGARYRGNASWMMNQVHINDVHEFGSDQYATWNGDLATGQTGQILGRPVYENSSMGSTLDGNTNSSAIYGDFSGYQIVDRVGASTEMVPHILGASNRPLGQRGFFHIWRVGAEATSDSNFVLMANPST